jgi:hypothetical protein
MSILDDIFSRTANSQATSVFPVNEQPGQADTIPVAPDNSKQMITRESVPGGPKVPSYIKREGDRETLVKPDAGDVKELQELIVSAGGKLPRYGVDGKWGNETIGALNSVDANRFWDAYRKKYSIQTQPGTAVTPQPATPSPAPAPNKWGFGD